MGFIRTGYLGTKVCLGRGAIVLPVFHEVTWISLETLKLIVSRSRDQAVLTSDKIRIDVVAELYAHVGRSEEDLLAAARSLGERTFDTEKVRMLLEAKIVSALRSFAATKTLSELHENRDAFAKAVQTSVVESFHTNGLTLEEVTIVTLEQSGKEFFDKDNVFDAEGLKVITEITSDARRQVHNTEKRTTVSIRQRELDTQLELLEIEKQEAFARAHQDREVANEQAQQIGSKQMYVLDQRMAVEHKEIDNEKTLERMRAERDISAIEESRRREAAEIVKTLELEKARRDREIELVAKTEEEQLANIQRKLAEERAERDRRIALVTKAKEEELAEIARELAREQAQKDKEIELISKEQARAVADIDRNTAVTAREEAARNERHQSSETTALSVRRRSLETRLATLEIDKDEAFAQTQQEREVANERARVLSEQQRFILEQRWQVEQDEIAKAQALESAQIHKEVAIIEETRKREAADIQRGLARETEERDRDIALAAKAGELEQAEVRRRLAVEIEERGREVALAGKDEEVERARVRKALAVEVEERGREVALTGKDEEVERARVRKALAVEVEERERDIALIGKEQERERADIQRFLAREQEERDRQIALAAKTRELEQAEANRLEMTARREQAEHDAESVRRVADATRQKEIDRIRAENEADARRIDEENRAQITRMHMLTQAEARSLAAQQEAEATLTRGARHQRGPADFGDRHRERGRRRRAGRGFNRGAAGRERPTPVPGRGGGHRGQGRRAQELRRVRDLPGAREAAHRGRARHPHRPGQGHGHRAHRRPYPHVRRRRRHRGQHPPALHIRLRDRGGAGGRGSIPARGVAGPPRARRHPGNLPPTGRRAAQRPCRAHSDPGGHPSRRRARHAVRGRARTTARSGGRRRTGGPCTHHAGLDQRERSV